MLHLGLNEIRERYLSFFESKSHLRLKSFSLIPENDKSLLIINSGMAPMKPYFTGQLTPPNKRVATCQKCVRTTDIEEVGVTPRHVSFLEMLGNFSFKDYFKKETIAWAWEFLTSVMEIPAEKLFISIFLDDDEAYDIWANSIGVKPERIVRLGREDNFWEHGTGPCGPSSEIHFDRGENTGCGKPDCLPGCKCDRFVEIWNLVFTQFDKDENGNYNLLDQPCIDTGMGLERISMVTQDAETVFDVDAIKTIRDAVCAAADTAYGADRLKDFSIKVITDHIRAVVFMTADGVLPSNEGRGYVLRRLLRRASMHGRRLGKKGVFFAPLADAVIGVYKGAYPELMEKRDYILKVLTFEENRFYETLGQGMELMKTHIARLKNVSAGEKGGDDAFKMYDTYGFPVELLKELLAEEQIRLNEDAFKTAMEAQRDRARAARAETDYTGADKTVYNSLPPGDPTVFTGYRETETEGASILYLISGDKTVESAGSGEHVSVICDKTPLYAESGGQRGDAGCIETPDGALNINDCIKITGDRYAAVGTVESGVIKTGARARVAVDIERRRQTAANHTATHLLHRALKDVLGGHVEQAGSLVGADGIRFDFTHFAPVTAEELERAEDIVNEKILAGLPVNTEETDADTARKKGAAALFGEKYGAVVRMVGIGDYSVELCGGTHLSNSSLAGVFKILSETGVAAGVRRIEAVTGRGAINYFKAQENKIKFISRALKTSPDQLNAKIESLMENFKNMGSEIARLHSQASGNIADDILRGASVSGGSTIIVTRVDGLDMNSLRVMGDKLRDKIDSGAVVLASAKDGKAGLFAFVTDDLVPKGVHAGEIVKAAAAICGGGGGGKAQSAQAGGRDTSKIDEALAAAKQLIYGRL